MNYRIWYCIRPDYENVYTLDILNAPSEKDAINMFKVFNPDMFIYHVGFVEGEIEAPVQYRVLAHMS